MEVGRVLTRSTSWFCFDYLTSLPMKRLWSCVTTLNLKRGNDNEQEKKKFSSCFWVRMPGWLPYMYPHTKKIRMKMKMKMKMKTIDSAHDAPNDVKRGNLWTAIFGTWVFFTDFVTANNHVAEMSDWTNSQWTTWPMAVPNDGLFDAMVVHKR